MDQFILSGVSHLSVSMGHRESITTTIGKLNSKL